MTDHPTARRVEAFARQVLGCQCAPEVFHRVGVAEDVEVAGFPLMRRIEVGQRLLIYVVDAEAVPLDRDAVARLAGAGAKERDGLGFNRFRLALAGTGPAPETPPLPDERCHIHHITRAEATWADG